MPTRHLRSAPTHRLLRLVALVPLAILAAGCGDEGPAPIDRIEVTRSDGGALEVMKGQVIVLKARAFAGNRERLDAVIRFRSENPEIAVVDSIFGVVLAMEYGTAQIAVTANREFTARVAVQVMGPPIARVVVVPAHAGAVIGGQVRVMGLALGAAGDTIPFNEFRWRSTAPSVLQVEEAGAAATVTGLAAGVGTVEGAAWNNVKGVATVTVLPIRDFAPRQGAFGTVVAITGSNLTAPERIAFSAGPAGAVEAEVGRVSPDAIYTWVPVGAESGPVTITMGGVTATLPGVFTVTGDGDDALEPNNEPSFRNPQIPIGFYNPALVARVVELSPFTRLPDEDWYLLPVPGGTREFTVEIGVRKGSGFTVSANAFRVDSLLHAVVWRLEGGNLLRWVAGYPGAGLFSYDFAADSAVRTLRVARKSLEPDTFFVWVLANPGGSSMPYSLRVRDSGVYAFGPDEFEENDAPDEAKAIGVPAEFAAFAENGGELDYYGFALAERATLRATLSGGSGDLDLWVGTETTDLALGLTESPDEKVEVVLERGQYQVAVWEFAMRGSPYNLKLELLPPSAASAGAVAGALPGAAGDAPPKVMRGRGAGRPLAGSAADALRLPVPLRAASPLRVVIPWAGKR